MFLRNILIYQSPRDHVKKAATHVFGDYLTTSQKLQRMGLQNVERCDVKYWAGNYLKTVVAYLLRPFQHNPVQENPWQSRRDTNQVPQNWLIIPPNLTNTIFRSGTRTFLPWLWRTIYYFLCCAENMPPVHETSIQFEWWTAPLSHLHNTLLTWPCPEQVVLYDTTDFGEGLKLAVCMGVSLLSNFGLHLWGDF